MPDGRTTTQPTMAEVLSDLAGDAVEFVSRESRYLFGQVKAGTKEAIASGGLGFAAGALGLSGYTVLSVGVGMLLARGRPRGPLIVGLVTMGVATGLAVAAWRRVPRWLVEDTRETLKHDVDALRGAFTLPPGDPEG